MQEEKTRNQEARNENPRESRHDGAARGLMKYLKGTGGRKRPERNRVDQIAHAKGRPKPERQARLRRTRGHRPGKRNRQQPRQDVSIARKGSKGSWESMCRKEQDEQHTQDTQSLNGDQRNHRDVLNPLTPPLGQECNEGQDNEGQQY